MILGVLTVGGMYRCDRPYGKLIQTEPKLCGKEKNWITTL